MAVPRRMTNETVLFRNNEYREAPRETQQRSYLECKELRARISAGSFWDLEEVQTRRGKL